MVEDLYPKYLSGFSDFLRDPAHPPPGSYVATDGLDDVGPEGFACDRLIQLSE